MTCASCPLWVSIVDGIHCLKKGLEIIPPCCSRQIKLSDAEEVLGLSQVYDVLVYFFFFRNYLHGIWAHLTETIRGYLIFFWYICGCLYACIFMSPFPFNACLYVFPKFFSCSSFVSCWVLCDAVVSVCLLCSWVADACIFLYIPYII